MEFSGNNWALVPYKQRDALIAIRSNLEKEAKALTLRDITMSEVDEIVLRIKENIRQRKILFVEINQLIKKRQADLDRARSE